MHIADDSPSPSSPLAQLRSPPSIGGFFTALGTGAIAMFESLVSGAVAGATAKTVIAPGDRIKIIYQVDPTRSFSIKNAFRTGAKIVEHGGVLNLWRGNGATMLRVVPSASITFMSFEHYQNLFDFLLSVDYQRVFFSGEPREETAHHQSLGSATNYQQSATSSTSALSRFCAGSMAGVTSTTLTYPLDMLRARYAAHNDPIHPRYPSYWQGVKEIWQVEGVKGLYGGLRPTVVGIIPYAGINFMVFGTFKANLVKLQGLKSEKEIPTSQRLVAGALSGLIAQSSTYPLDIVRRRMQVSTAKYAQMGITGTLSFVYRNEGLNGVFKGLTMNWVKGPIATAVSFTVHDLVKTRIKEYNKSISQYEVSPDGAITRHDGDPIRPVTYYERLLCGGMAGGLAKLWTAPFDRIKIMYNVGLQTCEQHAGWRQVLQQVREMMHESRGTMWQGSGAMMVRVVPYAGITYATYEPMKRVGQRVTYSRGESFLTNFIAGALSASLATVLLHPFDLIRVRSATYTEGPRYLSHRSALRQMISTGGARSLFEGVGPALLGIAPMAGFSFAIYEKLKRWATARANHRSDSDRDRDSAAPGGGGGGASSLAFAGRTDALIATEVRGPLPFWNLLAMGCVAGCISAAITYPLNIVRRRAMVEQVVLGGVVANLRDMYTSKLFYGGMYDRLPLGWVMGMMTVGFSFSIYDQLLYLALLARTQLHVDAGNWSSQSLWFALLPDLESDGNGGAGNGGDDTKIQGRK